VNTNEEEQLDDCLKCESGLSTWDIEFIESLDKGFRKRELSIKQITQLNRITDTL